MNLQYILALLIPFLSVLLITPLIIKFALRFGFTDKPTARKIHQNEMPRLGGLAIFIGVIIGYLAMGVYKEPVASISLGALLIIALGVLDDKFELSPKIKFLGQIVVAIIIIHSGLRIEMISFPFIERFDLGYLSIPITVIWIVGIINAINLIDGLDGLAAGISTISIGTIAILAMINGKVLILTLSLIVIGSTLGFLFYNFHPARIFMGDTGSMFLGYSIAVLSLLGLFKSVTLFTFAVPILILGVPVFDTFFAIVRRLITHKPISAPDKNHLHHRILALGFSHRQTVFIIYLLGIIFSISAILFSASTIVGSVIIITLLVVILHLIAEVIELGSERYKPLSYMYRKVFGKENS